jgi:hypothetical protein
VAPGPPHQSGDDTRALIDRAEFLYVECRVIHAPRRGGRALLIPSQIPKRFEKGAVRNGVTVERERREQFTVQWRGFENLSELLIGKQLPKNPQALSKVVVMRISCPAIEQAPQAGGAVMLAVDGVGTDQAAVFGNQEK